MEHAHQFILEIGFTVKDTEMEHYFLIKNAKLTIKESGSKTRNKEMAFINIGVAMFMKATGMTI